MSLNRFEGKMLGKGVERGDFNEHALLKRALVEVRRTLERNKISPNDFRDIFNPNKIAEDLAYVEKMERVFKETGTPKIQEAKKLALIFEGMFHKGAHEYGWLGEGTRVIKTSDVDDWRHGVDGIIELKETGRGVKHLAIGVDVTYSNQLKDKFKKIKDDIENGELTTIEYFRSGNFRGELRDIPRVIVGAERSNLILLCRDLFVNLDKKRLARHPFQILQLKQMRLELDAFANYARKLGKEDIAEIYERDAEIVRQILQKKSLPPEEIRMGEWENDRVLLAIKKELANL